MCGVTGFWSFPPSTRADAENLARKMANAIRHRGPDDAGNWYDERVGLALGMRRLAIIDLSPGGHQPMFSADGRYVIVFNGEIYNFREIKADLERADRKFKSASDTEVILEAASAWGFEKMIARIGGMFAFALWDKQDHALYLARDRLGKKPMYLYEHAGLVLFGSELKALCAHPEFPRQLDRAMIPLYLRYQYVPAPYSIYRDTIKLMPGQYAVIRADANGAPQRAEMHTYWDAMQIAHNGAKNLAAQSTEEQIAALENLLTDAVQKRMISDVPLGALLSGGIDSSLITALMQKASSQPVKTFSIGFEEAGFNEAEYARAVAQHLRTDHHELYVTPAETRAVIPLLPHIYDEPFADSSQIPTYVVSKLARQFVTVALSGDGGDELFGGYNRYFHGLKAWDETRRAPRWLKRAGTRIITAIPPRAWDTTYKIVEPILPASLRMKRPGEKAHKFAAFLGSRDGDALYRSMVSLWSTPAEVYSGDFRDGERDPLFELQNQINMRHPLDRMMLLDLQTYLPNDILVKVDRASMAVSLEMRAPFLDHRVVEMAWSLPRAVKVRNNAGKWILRQILYRYVPRELIDRPKTGFGIPVSEWIRGDLKEWAWELIKPEKLAREGIFRADVVQQYWDEHQSRRLDWIYRLWPLLMFQAWKEHWKIA